MSAPVTPMERVVGASPVQTAIQQVNIDMERYIKVMKPGVECDTTAGANAQRGFWKLLQFIMRQPPEVFGPAWGELLRIVAENKETFSTRCMRFMEHVPIAPQEVKMLQRLLYLICRTAEPRTRMLALKQIDLATATKDLPGAATELITAFYTSY